MADETELKKEATPIAEASPQSKEPRTKLNIEDKTRLLEIAPHYRHAMPEIHVQDFSRRLRYVTDPIEGELDEVTVYDDKTVKDWLERLHHGDNLVDLQERRVQ